MSWDVFISYSSKDLRYAETLHRRLAAEQLNVWFDKARLNAGCDWHAEIEAGCEDSRVVLPVLTPSWKASDWTKYDVRAEAVLPLVFEGTWSEVSTPPLERFQSDRVECQDGEPTDWPRLLRMIARVLAQPAPVKGRRVAHLRHLPNPYFSGRDRDLVSIHEELHRNPRASLTQGRVRAISGNGGWGKTTLVRHYAEKFWRCYPQMFWVDARCGLESEFARLHDLLLPESAKDGYKDADKAMRALAELQGPSGRLLIIDDVDDEQSVAPWIPKTGGCHTLITSRFAGWSAAIKSVHLYVLEAEPAIRFLCDRLQRDAVSDLERAACGKLADKLGYLPLALEQAAAYIEQQGEYFGFADYLRLFESAQEELLRANALGSTMYPDSVATTWKPTLLKLSPAAQSVLHLAAFVAPVPIPMTLLAQSPAVARVLAGDGTPAPTEGAPAEMRMRAILSELKRYSMVTFDGQAFRLHCLLQTVEREIMAPEERAKFWRAATSMLVHAAAGHGERTQLREEWKPLLPHVEALDASHKELTGVDPSTELAEILRDCYYSQGRYDEARPFAQLVLAEDEREFGEADPRCWADLRALGSVCWRSGRLVEAERAFQRSLDLARTLVGETSPSAVVSLGEVALMVDKQGDVSRAATLYQAALALRPADVAILGNYAYMLQNGSGDLGRARALYEQALAIAPDDVINLNNYAGLCLMLGELGIAEASLQAAWKTTAVRKDRFAARTLFFRAALACLRSESPGLFLGQLKTVLESGISPAPSENAAVIRHLRERLAPATSGLLAAVFDAINNRPALDTLTAMPGWREIPACPFDQSWPENGVEEHSSC